MVVTGGEPVGEEKENVQRKRQVDLTAFSPGKDPLPEKTQPLSLVELWGENNVELHLVSGDLGILLMLVLHICLICFERRHMRSSNVLCLKPLSNLWTKLETNHGRCPSGSWHSLRCFKNL